MTDERRRRKAKQARRGTWRAEPSEVKRSDDFDFYTMIRKALPKHPLHLLNLVSYALRGLTPSRYGSVESGDWESVGLGNTITNLSERRCRETTALLAVLAELLVDDEAMRDRCRQEVAARGDRLPKWIVGLHNVQVYRAVRRTNVFGDGDEVVIGARLPDGSECTFSVFVDHLLFSGITDVALLADPIDRALAGAGRVGLDTCFIDMDLADARVWVEQGVERAFRLRQQDWWIDVLPLINWLTSSMPAGGRGYQQPNRDEDQVNQLREKFLSSPAAAPFSGVDYRLLLEELMDSGTGDPLRWSPARVESILCSPDVDSYIPLEVALDAPALLRAYIPFAHARGGIRDVHTNDVLAVIDEMARGYKRLVLSSAVELSEFDDDWPAISGKERPGRAS